MRKKFISLLLATTMITSMFNTVALAANVEDQKTQETQIVCEICGHEHNEDCGYAEAVEGQPCIHQHSEDCGYEAGIDGTPCSHEHTEECYEMVTNCAHEHTDVCYPIADSGTEDTVPEDAETNAEDAANNSAELQIDNGFLITTPSEPTECTHECALDNGCIIENLNCSHEHNTDECYELVTNCVHAHSDECYPMLEGDVKSEEPTACTHQCNEVDGCVTKELNCIHVHEENCEFVAAIEGVPCNHEHSAECGYVVAVEARECQHECVSKEPLTPLTPATMDTTEKAAVTETCKLTISYFFKDSSKMLAPDYIAVLPKDSEYTVISPSILGFSVIDETQSQIIGDLSEDTSIVVYYDYSNNTAVYKVNYYTKNNGSSENVLNDSKEKYALIDSVINVEDKKIEGYKRLATDMTLSITADGKAEKNLYYVQDTNPYIVFNTKGSYIEPITAAVGADISTQVKSLPTPTRKGYVFDSWSEKIPTTMPENDLILEAVWTPIKSDYHVLYWFENANDDGYTLNESLDEIRSTTTDSTATATADDIAKGKIEDTASPFYGFNYSHDAKVIVNADGNSVLNIYYDREIWKIKFYTNPVTKDMVKSEYLALKRNIWKEFEGKYQSRVPKDFPTVAEMAEYYNKLEPLGANYKYVNNIDLDASKWSDDKWEELHTQAFRSVSEFFLESVVGEKTLKIFPFYKRGEPYLFSIKYHTPNLNDNEYALINHRQILLSGSNATLNLVPAKGFEYLNGYYKSGYTQEECDNEDWSVLGNWINQGTAQKLAVKPYTEIRMVRVKNTLNFHSNGEIIKTNSNVSYEAPIDLTYIPDNAPDNSKFAGWYTNPDYFWKEPLSTYTMPHTATTLYAKWVPKDVTVTFESNGGTTVPSQTIQIGAKAERPVNPTLQDGEFGGWYTSEGDRWIFDREVPSDMALYARWNATPMADYGIYHLMQGDNTELKKFEGTGHIGDIYLASAMGRDADDYREGIYLEADAVVKSLVLKDEAVGLRTISKNNKVTFLYNEGGVRDYTVSYYKQGTTEKLAEDKTVNATKLSSVTEFAETIEGYVANEFYKVAELQTNGENHIIFYYRAEGDVPAPTTYAVAYNANGGSGSVVDSSSPYEAGVTVTTLNNGFTYDNMEFIGWKDNEGNTYHEGKTFTMPAANVVLYAQWKSNGGGETDPTPDPTYTVSYDANGGSGTAPAAPTKYKENATVTVLANTFTNGSKGFIGWKDGDGKSYSVGATFSMPAKDIVLYAQWKSNNPGGGGGDTTDYTSLTVNKVWENDKAENRPTSITAQLYRNGTAYGKSVELNEQNSWAYTWRSLDDSYTWTVDEVAVPEGYEKTVTGSGTKYTITNKRTEDKPIEPGNPVEPSEPEKPITPPTEPSNPNQPTKPDKLPQTNDTSAMSLWLIMSILSGLGLLWVNKKKHCQ